MHAIRTPIVQPFDRRLANFTFSIRDRLRQSYGYLDPDQHKIGSDCSLDRFGSTHDPIHFAKAKHARYMQLYDVP